MDFVTRASATNHTRGPTARPRRSPGRPANDADTGKKLRDQPAKMFWRCNARRPTKRLPHGTKKAVPPASKAPGPKFAQNRSQRLPPRSEEHTSELQSL